MTANMITANTILAAEARLRRFPGLATVFCTFHDGILTLSGHVASQRLRRLAPMIVLGLREVCTIENEIVVVPVRVAAGRNSIAGKSSSDHERPSLHLLHVAL
jgi:hypothetical protein